MSIIQRYSQSLRNNPTDAEKHLWRSLRMKQLGVKFRRQVPIDQYIADFVCFERRVIVEVDGGHHSDLLDKQRTEYLEGKGFIVIRFWNNEVLKNVDGVLVAIKKALDTPT